MNPQMVEQIAEDAALEAISRVRVLMDEPSPEVLIRAACKLIHRAMDGEKVVI